MDTLAKGIVIALLCIAKLIITGLFLAIGFKLGYMVMDEVEKKRLNKQVA